MRAYEFITENNNIDKIVDIARSMVQKYSGLHYSAYERAGDHAMGYDINDPRYKYWTDVQREILRIEKENKQGKKGVTEDNVNLPSVLYHATYKPRLKSIKLKGLGGGGKSNWEDSKSGVVYLALDPNVAESYAETSDIVPEEWLDNIVILKISTAGLDPNKFHIDSNVQDNAGDTIEYHGVIPVSNISMYKQGVTEGKQQVERNGIQLNVSIDGATVDIRPMINGNQVGYVVFDRDGETLVADDLAIDEEYRGRGIAKIIYDYLKELGFTVKRSTDQLPAGKAFWDKYKGAQGQVWEDEHVDEMALSSYKTMGDFTKPGPFKDPDYKLVVHPKHIEKVTTFFENVPQDFRIFMSNIPGKTKYRESGEKSPEEIKQIFGDQIASQILQDTENTITIIYMGNYGLNRQIMNSWQIAHRIGHAITATGRYTRDKKIIEWEELDQYFFNQINSILQRYYNVETRGWSPEHRQQLNKKQEALLYQIGVQRSSRERNLNTTYEFLYEMLALYIKTGRVRLNPLPEYAGYGRMVGWKKEHKSYERYLRIRPEYRDENVRQGVTDAIASELTTMYDNILEACVGKVFVM